LILKETDVGKWWSLLFAVVMILCGGLFVVAPFFGWWLPEPVSQHAPGVDKLFYIILGITGFFFVLTEAILCVFMFKYGADRDKSAVPAPPGPLSKMFKPVTGLVTGLLNDAHKVEMAWTIVPAAILLYIAFAQVDTWADVKYQSRMPIAGDKRTPKTPNQVAVSARQFEWRVRYPNPTRFEKWTTQSDQSEVAQDQLTFGKFEQLDDVHTVNEVHVIKGTPNVVHLRTMDVIHSFNLPHLRVKQDALPGKIIPVWFIPTKSNTRLDKKLGIHVDGINPETGEHDRHHIWDLPCAELCGWGHYRMIGRLFVHEDQQDFLLWLKDADLKNRSHKTENIIAP
jgi:cytochrome c oxidase subunit 2